MKRSQIRCVGEQCRSKTQENLLEIILLFYELFLWDYMGSRTAPPIWIALPLPLNGLFAMNFNQISNGHTFKC